MSNDIDEATRAVFRKMADDCDWEHFEGLIIKEHKRMRRCRMCGLHLMPGWKAWQLKFNGGAILYCMVCHAKGRTEADVR